MSIDTISSLDLTKYISMLKYYFSNELEKITGYVYILL